MCQFGPFSDHSPDIGVSSRTWLLPLKSIFLSAAGGLLKYPTPYGVLPTGGFSLCRVKVDLLANRLRNVIK